MHWLDNKCSLSFCIPKKKNAHHIFDKLDNYCPSTLCPLAIHVGFELFMAFYILFYFHQMFTVAPFDRVPSGPNQNMFILWYSTRDSNILKLYCLCLPLMDYVFQTPANRALVYESPAWLCLHHRLGPFYQKLPPFLCYIHWYSVTRIFLILLYLVHM